MTNNPEDLYTPFQDRNREWFFEDVRGHMNGPFISEERCEQYANSAQERDEE